MAGSGTKELVLAGSKRPRMEKPRAKGWTREKQDAFIDRLGRTCNIAAALRHVKMSRSGLDRLRTRDAGFRARMQRTIAAAYSELELFAIRKMMDGTVKTVTKPDGGVETVHEYPLHLAVQLLRLHKDDAPAAEPELHEEDKQEVLERLGRKVEAVRRRLQREGKL